MTLSAHSLMRAVQSVPPIRTNNAKRHESLLPCPSRIFHAFHALPRGSNNAGVNSRSPSTKRWNLTSRSTIDNGGSAWLAT
jgi:hypothetical protein